MGSTDVSYHFKRKSYVGKIYLLDVNTRDIVTTGYGNFDTEALSLNIQIDGDIALAHDSVMTVLETTDGYFAPLMVRDFYSIGWGRHSSSHSMKSSVRWPHSKGLDYILHEFNEIRVVVDAHLDERLSTQSPSGKIGSSEATLTKKANFAGMGSAMFSRYNAEANYTFSWSSSNIRVRSEKLMDLKGHIAFTVKDESGNNFSFMTLRSALFAFKAYWLLTHGNVDSNLRHFKLGSDIDFIFEHSKLYAPNDSTPEFRSAISADADLHLETLLKCLHFVLNPDASDNLSSTSKTGLSLSSLVRHAYGRRPELLDHEAINLIVGFQGLSEAVAQNKIKETNRAGKTKTITEIEKIIGAIKAIEGELSDQVKEFYLKDVEDIYKSISRPTFKHSVDIALDELGIDKVDHAGTFNAVNKARKQIVHLEGYDSSNLIGLLTTAKNEIKRNENGDIIQMSLGVKTGELDKLYLLMIDMMRRYFDQFNP